MIKGRCEICQEIGEVFFIKLHEDGNGVIVCDPCREDVASYIQHRIQNDLYRKVLKKRKEESPPLPDPGVFCVEYFGGPLDGNKQAFPTKRFTVRIPVLIEEDLEEKIPIKHHVYEIMPEDKKELESNNLHIYRFAYQGEI